MLTNLLVPFGLTHSANVQLEISPTFCRPQRFTINGVLADSEDFGSLQDEHPEFVEPGARACGDRRFVPAYPANACTLSKYGITADDYCRIATELERRMSFGTCNWCSLRKVNRQESSTV